jgi:hypothetical protein
METEEEAEARKTDFRKIFHNERKRREQKREELFERTEAKY